MCFGVLVPQRELLLAIWKSFTLRKRARHPCPICPEMQVNEMHGLYDKHHKVSSFVKSHQNTHNSVKYEVI